MATADDDEDVYDKVLRAVTQLELNAMTLLFNVDEFLLTNDEHLPNRSVMSITNARSQATFLVTALRRVKVDMDAEEARRVRRVGDRLGQGPKPRWTDHEMAMTTLLIRNGSLPEGSTPDDFIAIQQRQRAKMAKLPPAGSIAAPSGPVGIPRKMRPGDDA